MTPGRASGPRRQPHRERAADARLRADLHRAVVLLDDRVGDREAQAAAGDRVLLGQGGAEEAVEEPLLLGKGYADPGVGHLEDDPAVLPGEGHLHLTAVGS